MSVTVENSIVGLSVISEKISILESKIDELSQKVAHLEGNKSSKQDFSQAPPVSPVEIMEQSEGFREWVSKGALLHKMAILCFILVIALLLRTVTDYGYINTMAGSFLGLTYVSILALIGCVFYVKGRDMANVFSISGFLLLFTIVFEGYSRFGTIPVSVAYTILFIALLTSAVVGIKYKVLKLLVVSSVGVTTSSLMIGFPQIHFPLSAILFMAANWVAIIVAERLESDKLKWPITFLTLIFWALWAFKANLPISRGEPVPGFVHIPWLLPLLICFVALYFITYLRRYFSEVRLTFFDAIIPSLNMFLLFLAGSVVIKSHWQQPVILGLLVMAVGFVHFAVGWRISTNDRGRFVAVGGSFVAGVIALALGAPVVVGNIAWAIAFWSLSAYVLARLSGTCNSAVIRLVSYLLQVFALMTGLGLAAFNLGDNPYASLTAAAALALFGFTHFNWCRRNPPPEGSLFARLDGKDHSAVIILLISLVGMFLFSGMIVDLVASSILADPDNSIRCGRSIIINFGATILLILAGRHRNMELVWIAVFLAIIGCLKVFLVDLFGASGIPLVLSVLSFGFVAMVGSIVMGKWNKAVEK